MAVNSIDDVADYKNKWIVYGKAATEVVCEVWGHILVRPTGDKATIEGEITETVERRLEA